MGCPRVARLGQIWVPLGLHSRGPPGVAPGPGAVEVPVSHKKNRKTLDAADAADDTKSPLRPM